MESIPEPNGLAKQLEETYLGESRREEIKSILADMKIAEEGYRIFREDGPAKASPYFHRNARVFEYILQMDDRHVITKQYRIYYALFHFPFDGYRFPLIRKCIQCAAKYRMKHWDGCLPECLRNEKYFRVYRAGSESIFQASHRLSWTLSRDIAESEAEIKEKNGEGKQHIYTAVIPRKNVISYIDERNEFEILQYRGVRFARKIKRKGISRDFMRFVEGVPQNRVAFNKNREEMREYVIKQLEMSLPKRERNKRCNSKGADLAVQK